MPVHHDYLRAAQKLAQLRHPNGQARWAPLRSTRALHTTRSLRDDASHQNHYDTLKVSPDASPSEIKKSFYSLSKAHHPDHNPSDPHASKRFMRISEAYAVLGHASKRAAYDRDVLRRPQSAAAKPKGSYHSTGPAGGRPASGLSKRRGTFHGPPPSFYRSGGWGAHGAKRQAAHEESTGGGGSSHSGAGTAGGMGPGQDPFGHRSDVPHFDHASHERTHRRRDEHLAGRRMRKHSTESEDGLILGFFRIAGLLAIAIVGPALVIKNYWGTTPERIKVVEERRPKRKSESS